MAQDGTGRLSALPNKHEGRAMVRRRGVMIGALVSALPLPALAARPIGGSSPTGPGETSLASLETAWRNATAEYRRLARAEKAAYQLFLRLVPPPPRQLLVTGLNLYWCSDSPAGCHFTPEGKRIDWITTEAIRWRMENPPMYLNPSEATLSRDRQKLADLLAVASDYEAARHAADEAAGWGAAVGRTVDAVGLIEELEEALVAAPILSIADLAVKARVIGELLKADGVTLDTTDTLSRGTLMFVDQIGSWSSSSNNQV